MFQDKLFFALKYWLPILFWMAVIFYFSGQPDLESGLPHIYDFILRKIAHVTEYLILTVLSFRALKQNLDIKKALFFAALFAFLYAISDEYHQIFVAGREGTIRDVLIDSIGIVTAIYFLTSSTIFPKIS